MSKTVLCQKARAANLILTIIIRITGISFTNYPSYKLFPRLSYDLISSGFQIF